MTEQTSSGQPTGDEGATAAGTTPEQAERLDPEHARSEVAAETPPHADAEEMESALREHGPLVTDDQDEAAARREAPTEDGPGVSLM